MAIKKLGTIVNFFGLKGQLKVSVSTSQAEERFKVGKKIILKNNQNEDETFIINYFRAKDSRIVILGLDGYNNINQIQWMIGKDIYANVRAPKGQFFFDELAGMNVYTDNGELVGLVDTIVTMKERNYLLINKTTYIPFLMDTFIQSVDKKEKKIILTALGTETTK